MVCRSLVFGSFLISQTIAFQATADDLAYDFFLFNRPVKEEPAEVDESCGESPRPMRITVSHIEGKGIGYDQGYTTLESFFSPVNPWGSWVPFLDVRGHVFDNGKLAANAGLGMRYIRGSRIYGINAYYDYRDTKRAHYNQVSAGLECLGRSWDFRINGYLPVGDKESSFYDTKFKAFQGNSIILSRKQEYALKAANAEVGYHLDYFEKVPVYFAAGPYYVSGTGASAWGGEGRVVVDLYDYVSVEGNTSYDSLFGWIGQGQLSINIPLGPRRKVRAGKQSSCGMMMSLSKRAVQRVDRNEIIPVDKQRVKSKAIDPATGAPFLVWFVDNTSHSAGTYESPFATLLAAQSASGPNDIIYIFPGDQTTTGMDAGIFLQDNQRLWGSAISQSLPTTVGTVQIPAFSNGPYVNHSFGTDAALLPIITSTKNVVVVGNNNEISGLYILNPSGNAIIGSGVSNLNVHNNTIQGTAGVDSLSFTDLSGLLLVENNSISSNSSNYAIALTNSSTTLNAIVSNNQIVSSEVACAWNLNTQGTLQFTDNKALVGVDAVYIIQGTGSSVAVDISNNQIEMFGSALLLEANGADAVVTMKSNYIDGGGSPAAIEFDQSTGTLTATIASNRIVNYGPGILVNAAGDNALVTLESNNISIGEGNPNSVHAIEIDQTAGSLTAMIASNKTLTGDSGMLVNAGGSGTTVSFKSNNITTYYGNGIDLQQTLGPLNASIIGNTIAAQDNNGFNYAISSDLTSTGSVAVRDNIISGFQPISIHQSVGTLSSLIDNNTLSANFTGAAVTLFLDTANASQNATISNNVVTQSNGDGFDLLYSNAGSAVWNVDGNSFNGLAGYAVKVSNNGIVGVVANICVGFTDNVAYPIKGNVYGTYLLDNRDSSGPLTLQTAEGNIGEFTLLNATEGPCPI